jgi:AcrR family transcriptional regulator
VAYRSGELPGYDPPTVPPPNPSPPSRADARRNRQRLIAAATAAFASGESTVSMASIAKRAGVGSGTLYRHFPTRDDLVEEVYRDQIQQLQTAAHELLAAESPAQALRMWMDVFADWAATKYGMYDALSAIIASGRIGSGQMHHEFQEVLRLFLEAGGTPATCAVTSTRLTLARSSPASSPSPAHPSSAPSSTACSSSWSTDCARSRPPFFDRLTTGPIAAQATATPDANHRPDRWFCFEMSVGFARQRLGQVMIGAWTCI